MLSLAVGLSMDRVPAVSILGAHSGDGLGTLLGCYDTLLQLHSAVAGDFNGDGYADFIVGSPLATFDSKTGAGVSYLIFGNQSIHDLDLLSLSPSQGIAIYGGNAHDYVSYSVGGVGDINQDGYDDVYVSSHGDENGFYTLFWQPLTCEQSLGQRYHRSKYFDGQLRFFNGQRQDDSFI